MRRGGKFRFEKKNGKAVVYLSQLPPTVTVCAECVLLGETISDMSTSI